MNAVRNTGTKYHLEASTFLIPMVFLILIRLNASAVENRPNNTKKKCWEDLKTQKLEKNLLLKAGYN